MIKTIFPKFNDTIWITSWLEEENKKKGDFFQLFRELLPVDRVDGRRMKSLKEVRPNIDPSFVGAISVFSFSFPQDIHELLTYFFSCTTAHDSTTAVCNIIHGAKEHLSARVKLRALN